MTCGPVMMDIEGLELTGEDRQMLAHPLIGGVILFTRNYHSPAQLQALTAQIHGVKSPSLIIAVDQEGGRVQRFRAPFFELPPMATLGRLYDEDAYQARQLAEDCGWLMACELRNVGVDLDFAPVLDLDYGCSAVIGDRAFHQQAEVVAELACALIAGLHSGGLSTCGKHFPGHGAVTGDSHHELPVDARSRAEIERDLLPFRAAMRQGLESIMTAHVVTTCEDQVPVSFSSQWLTRILREDLGFKGIIFSDDLSMQGAALDGGITEKVSRALQAGCEFLPICNDRAAVIELCDSNFVAPPSRSFASLRALHPVPLDYQHTSRFTATRQALQDLKPA